MIRTRTHTRLRQGPPPLSQAALPVAQGPLTPTTEGAAERTRSRLTLSSLALAGLGLLTACKPQAPPTPLPPDPECALVMIDSFGSASHGRKVRGAAERLGEVELVAEYDQAEAPGAENGLPFRRISQEFGQSFSRGPLSLEEASQALNGFYRDVTVESLDLISSVATEINGKNFQNSGLNVSLGLNQLHLVDMAEGHLQSRSLSSEQRSIYRENLERALSLPSEASARERKQALLDRAAQVVEQDEEALAARQRWRNQVVTFEAAHNSVAVSAGNDGGKARALRRDGYRLSPNADENFLSVPEVTVVGATSSGTRLADYTRTGPEVDLFASGNHGFSQGTSFASPKVTAALRSAHCQNPGSSSEDMEALIADELTQKMSSGKALLDLDLTRSYIAQ